MGRYRAPAPPKSPYITQAGFSVLETEQEALWKKRREVVKHLSAAAAEGDRSENAEYIYRKKQLREMDRRILYLQKRIPDLKVVSQAPSNIEQVFFGAWVTLLTETGGTVCYRIVGPDEFDPKLNWISIDSPMAKALMKKNLDDEFSVELPNGRAEFEITQIEYQKNQP